MRAPIRLLTVRSGLLVITGVVFLLLVSWTSQAAPIPQPLAQKSPTPVPTHQGYPTPPWGLHPPGMEPRGAGAAPTQGPGAASVVLDPPRDARPGEVLWPYPEPDRGLTVGGVNIRSQWCWPNPGNYWFAATFQEIDGELQVRDVAPNTGPVRLGSGPISDGHEIFPRWLDILAGGHAWSGSGCSVFTMTVAQDIPSDAWDALYAWPVLDWYGNMILMPFVYKGVAGWEHALPGSAVTVEPAEADVRSAAVQRQSDGWIELALQLNILPPFMDAIWFWRGPHAMAAWLFDADANANTGAPGGAEVMVEVWLNPTAKSYEALVKRWEGYRWVYKMTLQPPVVNHTAATIRVRVGPATLALNTNFSWWVSTAKTMGLIPDTYITNVMDRVPDAGAILEGPDFWIIPPTPTFTPTCTPTRTSTPGPLVFQGIVQYSGNRGLISGATLWLDQKQGANWVTLGQTTTDANGRYQITLSVTRTADYRLRCRVIGPLGPRDQTREMIGIPAGTMIEDFWFEPIIRVRGQVAFNGGSPDPSTVMRKVYCAWSAGCVTFPWTWWEETKSAPVALEADGHFDTDGYFPWAQPDAIRLKVFPPVGQRVANIAVPDGCEALAIDLVECLDLREGIYDGVMFALAPALTPTPTPSPTPTGPWVAWTDPDGLPIGAAGRTLSFRFEALPYTGTLTVTLGPGLEFPDGTAEKRWALRVLRGRMQVTVRGLQTHLGQQSWVRGSLLGMEDTLPVRLVWQTWLPGAFRHTGWREYAFGVRFIDTQDGTLIHGVGVSLEQCTGEPCVWQYLDILTDTADGNYLFEPEGLRPPYKLAMIFPTSAFLKNTAYVLDHVDLDGPASWDPAGYIVYDNPPPGRYTRNVVYMRPQPSP